MSSIVDLTPQTALDGLPTSFIESLRTLFDILDEGKIGAVSLKDIEARWSENAQGLPPGVLEALKTVTPPNGSLSFERFVGGLRIALVRARSETPSASVVSRTSRTTLHSVESQLKSPNQESAADHGLGKGAMRHLPHHRAHSAPSNRHTGFNFQSIQSNGFPNDRTAADQHPSPTLPHPRITPQFSSLGLDTPSHPDISSAQRYRQQRQQQPQHHQKQQHPHCSPHYTPSSTYQFPPQATESIYGGHASRPPEIMLQQPLQFRYIPRDENKFGKEKREEMARKRHSVTGNTQQFQGTNVTTSQQFSPRAAALVHPMPPRSQSQDQSKFTGSKSVPNLKRPVANETEHTQVGTAQVGTTFSRQRASNAGPFQESTTLPTRATTFSDNHVSPGSDEVFIRQKPLSSKNPQSENTKTAFARVAPRVATQQEDHYAKPRSQPISQGDPLRSQSGAIRWPLGSAGSRRSEVMDVLRNWQHTAIANETPTSAVIDAGSKAETTTIKTNFAAKETTKGANESRDRRKDARRHTLNNGVDYNMLKRLKQVEQERDLLLQGLNVLDKAREWYQEQLRIVAEKHQQVTKNIITEYNFEGHQEQLMFQMARIAEVNQQLEGLIQCKDKAFLDSMNLAVSTARPSNETSLPGVVVHRLKKQNDDLFKDLDQKSKKISQLENEKAVLIRELFDARAQASDDYDGHRNSSVDKTFM